MRLLRGPATGALTDEAPGSTDTSVEVHLEPAERRASLVLREPGAPVIERTVEGENCTELASGMALITALAFGGPQSPLDSVAGDAPASERAPLSMGAAVPPSSARPPLDEPLPVVAPARAPADDHPSLSRPTIASAAIPLDLEVGGGAWLNTWSSPNGNLGANVFFRLADRSRRAWSVRLGGLYGTDSASVGDRRAEFTFIAGRAEGCPLARPLVWNLSGEACLALDLGALRGRGDADSALLAGSTQTVFWAASVLTSRLRARFGERISLEGQAELGFPLVRQDFVFQEPHELIFRIPTLGVGAGLALGAEIL